MDLTEKETKILFGFVDEYFSLFALHCEEIGLTESYAEAILDRLRDNLKKGTEND